MISKEKLEKTETETGKQPQGPETRRLLISSGEFHLGPTRQSFQAASV
jgi:hypothetical protein